MGHKELALERFSKGYNCAQSVFTVFAEEYGMDADQAWRVSALFGGGIARSGQTCGAVTGALMALGLLKADYQPQDSEAKDRLNRLALKFLESFQQIHQTTDCRELIGHDLRNPNEHHHARESGVFTNRCPLLVETSVVLLEEFLKVDETTMADIR